MRTRLAAGTGTQMPSRWRIADRIARLGLPRPTVRFRLTMLYSTAFLVGGGILVGGTYALFIYNTGKALNSGFSTGKSASHDSGQPGQGVPTVNNGLNSAGRGTEALLNTQHASDLHLLLVTSVIALGVVCLISVALGWIAAGRILRPLQTIISVARDISVTDLQYRFHHAGPDDELKELSDTFDGLLARLEAAFQAQRQFIANASHELRTPLARQRILSQVALTDPDATVESLRSAHERVLAGGAQLEQLIESLLTLARGQAGISVREPFDLASLTGHVLKTRMSEAESLGLKVHTSLTTAPAAGSPHLAERLAANLIDNAIRHNVAGGDVHIVTGTAQGRSFLSVTNSGPVVPATDVSQLFQPFQRFGDHGHARIGNGLGLGMSIVEAIATAHGATINARLPQEGGLAIVVSFPPPAVPHGARAMTATASAAHGARAPVPAR
jgi:signal transduction histidine kinase